MGGVVSKKISSSKSIDSSQSSKYQQRQNSSLNKNKKSSLSISSYESSFLQQPHALFDKNSTQSYNQNDSMTFTTSSSYRDSNIMGKNAYNDVERMPENVHQTNSFFLPKDWNSKEYQYNLHFALKTLFNGNVTPAVAPALKKGAHVIQMGTCSSAWIMDMATHYPDCKFTGFELGTERIQNLPSLPNITIERGNVIENGLTSVENESIDYVHFRSVGSLLKLNYWPQLFSEIKRILKPDGVIRIEEMHFSPKGTIMIESFVETIKGLFRDMNHDPEIAFKYGNILQTEGFQVIETRKKRVHLASDGKLGKEFVAIILNLYEQRGPIIAPRLGLDLEDYGLRIEQICAECVKLNSYLEWYSYVGRKNCK